MKQEQVNVLDYADKDESTMIQPKWEEGVNENGERNGILKKVDGRLILDGRVKTIKRSSRGIRILKKSAARLNGRTTLFKKPNQMFWVL